MSQNLDKNLTQQFQVAVEHHQQGRLGEARLLYESLLEKFPEQVDLRHNLGAVYLGLGLILPGVEMMESAIQADPENIGMAGSPKLIGMHLMNAGYWPQARTWLLEAIQKQPDDQEVSMALSRLAPRSYLTPDVYDEREKRSLKRCSPKESETYVYTIDIVGSCNLACPSCPVGNSPLGERSQRVMSLPLFTQILEKIADESPAQIPQIWLYNWGEPLLHPKLPEIVELIHARGYSSHLSSNLNIEKGLKPLIKAKPTELKISLSGFAPDTYSLSHEKGDIHLVKSNLYRLRKYLDQYKASTRIWVGHHQYKHNAHEIALVRSLCDELKFEHHPIQAFYQPLEKLIAMAEGDKRITQEPIMQQFLVEPARQVAFSKQHRQADYDCELRFNQTVINSDGSVALCCSQYASENALGVQFLDESHRDLETRKYNSKLCQQCRSHGLDYSPKSLPNSTKV